MSAEQRLARLDELAAWLIATVAHLRKPSNEPAAQRQAKLGAAAAFPDNLTAVFYVLAGICVAGVVFVLLTPRAAAAVT